VFSHIALSWGDASNFVLRLVRQEWGMKSQRFVHEQRKFFDWNGHSANRSPNLRKEQRLSRLREGLSRKKAHFVIGILIVSAAILGAGLAAVIQLVV
jgi:hypothetical protein